MNVCKYGHASFKCPKCGKTGCAGTYSPSEYSCEFMQFHYKEKYEMPTWSEFGTSLNLERTWWECATCHTEVDLRAQP